MRVVVIGAGLMGVCTAYFLTEDGHDVTVLEREKEAGLGTSYANGSILTPSMADPWNEPGVERMLLKYLGKEDSPLLLRPKAIPSLMWWGLKFLRNSAPDRFERATRANAKLSTYSVDVHHDITNRLGLKFDQGPGGDIKFTRDQKAFELLQAKSKILSDVGVAYELLDADGLVGKEPALASIRNQMAGGIFFPDDASGDARLFTKALAAEAEKRGVKFVYNSSVSGFVRNGDNVTAIQVGTETYAADAVVLASGTWTEILARRLGIRVSIKPVKGYSITVSAREWTARPRLPVIDDTYHAVVAPLGERLRVAGTAEFTGFDAMLTPSRIENLKTMVVTIYPEFKPYLNPNDINAWAGFRPMSADGLPYIGKTRLTNVYMNAGHGHLGWTMASGSGRLLADMISNRATAIDVASFNPTR